MRPRNEWRCHALLNWCACLALLLTWIGLTAWLDDPVTTTTKQAAT